MIFIQDTFIKYPLFGEAGISEQKLAQYFPHSSLNF